MLLLLLKKKTSAVAGKAAAAADTSSAVAETQLAPEDAVGAIEALQWSTGVLDKGVLHSLLASLPAWAVKEQVLAHRGREEQESPKPQLQPLTFDPALWHSRMKVAEVFGTYLRSCGVPENSRIPRNSTIRFVRARLVLKKNMKESQVCRWIRRWHPQWKESGKRPAAVVAYSKKMCYGSTPHQKRRRGFGGGQPVACGWVRESLWEWYVSVRYSIDWGKFNERLRSCGRYKAMGRFPLSLVRQKAKQLLHDYLRICCIAGAPVKGVANFYWKWFKRWQKEYGLSMRAPNRKYKVPKWLLEERLIIWWLNIARVRAL